MKFEPRQDDTQSRNPRRRLSYRNRKAKLIDERAGSLIYGVGARSQADEGTKLTSTPANSYLHPFFADLKIEVCFDFPTSGGLDFPRFVESTLRALFVEPWISGTCGTLRPSCPASALITVMNAHH